MRTALDNYLGIHPQALTLAARRNELLAANLANVDTPNFKARDIDFKAALAAAGSASGGTLPLTPANQAGIPAPAGPTSNYGSTAAATPRPDAGALSGTAQTSASALDPTLLKYRIPMAPALDGNTVDEQLDQSSFAENAVRYQATLTFLSSKLRDLMTAITGS